MLIEYVHASAPNETRVYNTLQGYRSNLGLFLTDEHSHESFAQGELKRMERDLRAGKILHYNVLDETNN